MERSELPEGSTRISSVLGLILHPSPHTPPPAPTSVLPSYSTPAPPFTQPPSLADSAAEWTSLWAYVWGHETRRPPTNNLLHPLGMSHQLPLLVYPVLPLPVPAPALPVLLPPATALPTPLMQLPVPPAPASLAHPAPAPALPVLPQLVTIALVSHALIVT